MECFIQFLTLYAETAENACGLLRRYLEIDNPMYWRQSGLAKSGQIGPNMEYEYIFHGTDCKFNFGGSKIDFEFGYDGRVGGFNEWKLLCFAQDGTSNYTQFRNESVLEKCFEKAKVDGFIDMPYLNQSDTLYYLVVDADNAF